MYCSRNLYFTTSAMSKARTSTRTHSAESEIGQCHGCAADVGHLGNQDRRVDGNSNQSDGDVGVNHVARAGPRDEHVAPSLGLLRVDVDHGQRGDVDASRARPALEAHARCVDAFGLSEVAVLAGAEI